MTLKPLEELFGYDEEEQAVNKKIQIVDLDPEKVRDFNGHPFEVKMDEDMAELVDSIKRNGVLQPGIARMTADGGHEAITGHRRKYACRLAGQTSMPFIVGDYTDDEATIIMVESNIHRPNISIREKAYSYRMHYEAAKRLNKKQREERLQGKEAQEDKKVLRSDEQLAKKSGESRNKIQRYIRLTYLIPELLDMADTGKLPIITASDLSYLKKEEQELLLHYMQSKNIVPSGTQALELKEHSKKREITMHTLDSVLRKAEAKATQKVVLKRKTLSQYFPEGAKPEEIENVIIMLLQKWQKENAPQNQKSEQIIGQIEIEELEDGRYMPG